MEYTRRGLTNVEKVGRIPRADGQLARLRAYPGRG